MPWDKFAYIGRDPPHAHDLATVRAPRCDRRARRDLDANDAGGRAPATPPTAGNAPAGPTDSRQDPPNPQGCLTRFQPIQSDRPCEQQVNDSAFADSERIGQHPAKDIEEHRCEAWRI
jgi:hypothetical protein